MPHLRALCFFLVLVFLFVVSFSSFCIFFLVYHGKVHLFTLFSSFPLEFLYSFFLLSDRFFFFFLSVLFSCTVFSCSALFLFFSRYSLNLLFLPFTLFFLTFSANYYGSPRFYFCHRFFHCSFSALSQRIRFSFYLFTYIPFPSSRFSPAFPRFVLLLFLPANSLFAFFRQVFYFLMFPFLHLIFFATSFSFLFYLRCPIF